MDLDLGSDDFELGSLNIGSSVYLDVALQVYKETWDAFYRWEEEYCRKLIQDCHRPTSNMSHAREDDMDSPALEFQFKPPFKENVEYFTVEDFDSSGNSVRYSTMTCLVKLEGRQDGSPPYEFCTLASRSVREVNVHAGSLPFLPYADDIKFNVDSYLSLFESFSWQTDFPDPDCLLLATTKDHAAKTLAHA
ncbi:hypothetical protein H0H93_008050 [Arthromyces matolae]|nr:hypothetical protein H0H93_008050 [Arthromyces matolae]